MASLLATASPLADTQTHDGSLERGTGDRLFGGGRWCRERLLRLLARLTRALDVDLLDVLGGLREHDDTVAAHVHEAAEDRQRLFDAAALHAELARPERGEQRSVMRQDPEVSLAAGRDDHVDVVLVDLALRRDDLEVERHQAASFAMRSPFSRACSMVPTLKNACSGRSSCLDRK